MKLSELTVNAKAQAEGEWVKIPGYDDFEVQSRGFSYVPYRRAHEMALAKAARGLKKGESVPVDEREKILAKQIVTHLSMDWRGMTDDSGAPLKFDRDDVLLKVQDPTYRPLFDALVYAAGAVGEQAEEVKEAAQGN